VLDFEGDSHECDFAGKSYGESLLYSSEGLTHSQASGLVLVSEPASARGYALVCGVRYYCGINTDGVCPRDFGVECSFEDDDDCAGSSFSLRSYFGGGSLPKHEFFGQFNLSGPPQTPVPAGTPVFVNSSTGDYWITRVGDGGLYSVNVSFDNLSTGFDEGTVEGAGLSFSVSGASVPELQVASSGARTELNFVLPAGSCVPGASCSSSGCVGSWFKLNRSGVGHDACLYPNYLGCVRNSSVGFFDQACCLGIVSQMIYY
jgi:hypothetical protein